MIRTGPYSVSLLSDSSRHSETDPIPDIMGLLSARKCSI